MHTDAQIARLEAGHGQQDAGMAQTSAATKMNTNLPPHPPMTPPFVGSVPTSAGVGALPPSKMTGLGEAGVVVNGAWAKDMLRQQLIEQRTKFMGWYEETSKKLEAVLTELPAVARAADVTPSPSSIAPAVFPAAVSSVAPAVFPVATPSVSVPTPYPASSSSSSSAAATAAPAQAGALPPDWMNQIHQLQQQHKAQQEQQQQMQMLVMMQAGISGGSLSGSPNGMCGFGSIGMFGGGASSAHAAQEAAVAAQAAATSAQQAADAAVAARATPRVVAPVHAKAAPARPGVPVFDVAAYTAALATGKPGLGGLNSGMAVRKATSSRRKSRNTIDQLGINHSRPGESYAELAFYAIKACPNSKATVREIYDWVEDTYPFYKHQGAVWWKNCIRHNLSMKPMFVRHQDAGGPGMHMWSVRDGLDADSAIPRRRRSRVQAQSAMAQEVKAMQIETSTVQEESWRAGSMQGEDHPHAPLASLLEAADQASSSGEDMNADYYSDGELDEMEALKAETAAAAANRVITEAAMRATANVSNHGAINRGSMVLPVSIPVNVGGVLHLSADGRSIAV
jgi:hypothetical protein